MKNFLICILLLTLVFWLCGCGGDNPSGSKTSGLEQYITNSDEVTAIIQERFTTNDLTYENMTMESQLATLSQFGNGIYTMRVNGVTVTVNCQNHIASVVFINTGAGTEHFYTPSAATPTPAPTASDNVAFMGWSS